MKKTIWNYIKQNKIGYLIVIIALMIDFITAVVPTRMVQSVIDTIADNTLTQDNLNMKLFILAAATIIAYISSYVWIKILYSNSTRFQYQLRLKAFDKVIKMHTQFYEKFRSGDMLTRFTSDVKDFSELIGYGAMSVLFALGTIIVVIPTMLLLSWQITILAAIPIILIAVFVTIVGKTQDIAVEESRESVANLSNEVLEVVEGIRVTRAYGNASLGFNRFRKKTQDLAEKSNRIAKFQMSYGRVAACLLALSTTIVIGVGAYYMQKGWISIGEIVALQLYTLLLMDPVFVVTDLIFVYQAGKISFSKIQELLDTNDDMEADGTRQLDEIKEITFQNYHFRYMNEENDSLTNINVTIKQGETLGIVGRTGSGKTTFIRQLLRQYPVHNNVLLINGYPIQDYTEHSLHEHIGYVPQEHILFSRSVLENIRFGKKSATLEDVEKAIDVAAFSEDVKRMTHGLDTLVGEKGVSISGGQKQRISIARAMIAQPDLLILDDSLSAVDAKTERQIIENIQTSRQNKTNIIVTHRLSAVNHADWIIVLDQGQIIESGRPDDLLQYDSWYKEQYERQQLTEEA